MRIGQLANKAGVNIQTIRFYERRGILPKPSRSASGYRSYVISDLESIRIIKRSQQLGFTLKEIKQLMQLHQRVASLPARSSRRPAELRDIAQLARVKLQNIEQKLRALRTMRVQLLSMIDKLETVNLPGCPASENRAEANQA